MKATAKFLDVIRSANYRLFDDSNIQQICVCRPVEPEDPDEETEESLAKARAWDDWKDTHRRGEGNRHNRS